jgi:hypothetical protein
VKLFLKIILIVMTNGENIVEKKGKIYGWRRKEEEGNVEGVCKKQVKELGGECASN